MTTVSETIHVDIASKASQYDIQIGKGILYDLGERVSEVLGKRRVIVITDENVAALYLARAEASLRAAGHEVLRSIVLEAGESTKRLSVYEVVMSELFARKADRKTVFVALGGGVIGDIVGFAGATFMRGVDVVQVPTTLLAQVDSSVGGKTAIDTSYGKNTIGAFFQPRLVLADVATLDTLPQRELACGYAEVVKYGLIRDPAFFGWCQANVRKLMNGDEETRTEARIYAVTQSCKHKAEIVALDERDTGIRELLNFGHTFGHPLECLTNYGNAMLHGEAVAIGMLMAFCLSAASGFCSFDDVEKVRSHFAIAGLPTKPPSIITLRHLDDIMRLMSQDKKAAEGRMTLILTRGIGKAFSDKDTSPSQVQALWQEMLEQGHF